MAHKKRNSPLPSSILLLATIQREPSRTALLFSTSRAALPSAPKGGKRELPRFSSFPPSMVALFSLRKALGLSLAFAARLGGPPGKDDVRAKERALSSSIFHFGSIRRLPARLFGGGGGAHHKAFPLRRHFSRPPSAPFSFLVHPESPAPTYSAEELARIGRLRTPKRRQTILFWIHNRTSSVEVSPHYSRRGSERYLRRVFLPLGGKLTFLLPRCHLPRGENFPPFGENNYNRVF